VKDPLPKDKRDKGAISGGVWEVSIKLLVNDDQVLELTPLHIVDSKRQDFRYLVGEYFHSFRSQLDPKRVK
jgi:hypothetical protein